MTIQFGGNEERLEQWVERFKELQDRRESLEQDRAENAFRRFGGTDDEMMKERPPQSWELAWEIACMDDARAIESTIDYNLSELQKSSDEDSPLSADLIREVETDLQELENELKLPEVSDDDAEDAEESGIEDDDDDEDW